MKIREKFSHSVWGSSKSKTHVNSELASRDVCASIFVHKICPFKYYFDD